MENTHIGHLTKVEGNLFTVKILSDDEGYNPVISTGSTSTLVGQIGTHVSVKHQGVHVLGTVTSTWESSEQGKTARPFLKFRSDQRHR